MLEQKTITAAIECTKAVAVKEIESLIGRLNAALSNNDIMHLGHNVASAATALSKLEGELRVGLIVRPKHFLAGAFRGVNRLIDAQGLYPTLRGKQLCHKRMVIARNRDFALAAIRRIGKLTMLFLIHLESVGFRVPACCVEIWRVTIKKRCRAIIESQNIDRRAILYLNAKKPMRYIIERLDAAEPSGHDARHTGAACILAVGPATQRSRLRQSGARLSRPNVEAARPFHVRNPLLRPVDS